MQQNIEIFSEKHLEKILHANLPAEEKRNELLKAREACNKSIRLLIRQISKKGPLESIKAIEQIAKLRDLIDTKLKWIV